MKLSDYDYELDENLIAQYPAQKRENSRLFHLNKTFKTFSHKHFFDIVDILTENDLLVMNNTKVFPSRLFARKSTGALIEIFLLKELENKKWEVLLKPAKRLKIGDKLNIENILEIKLLDKNDESCLVELDYEGNIYDILYKIGQVPLPPYIKRDKEHNAKREEDIERYQTVFADKIGSVAAPTAGLHFSQDILQKLKDKGVNSTFLTLNVGLGTFRPVKCENILEHKMHSETYEISENSAEIIKEAISQKKTIVCVGTTSVRAIETTALKFGKIVPCKTSSELFIYPGFDFKVVNKILTNFHLPKSTLLMLVCAFAGQEFMLNAYREAVKEKYRFFSYGDCMFIE